MPSTAKGFPYPLSSASNNVPADLQAIADMLELWPGIPSLTQAQIDALAGGAKTPNLHVYNSTTGRLQRWNGSAWAALVEEGTAATGLVAAFEPNTRTADYTLALTDASKTVEMNVAGANTLTIPPNASVAFPIGVSILVVQTGAGQTSIAPGAGVTLRSKNSARKLDAQYVGASLYKRATNEWVLFGDISA